MQCSGYFVRRRSFTWLGYIGRIHGAMPSLICRCVRLLDDYVHVFPCQMVCAIEGCLLLQLRMHMSSVQSSPVFRDPTHAATTTYKRLVPPCLPRNGTPLMLLSWVGYVAASPSRSYAPLYYVSVVRAPPEVTLPAKPSPLWTYSAPVDCAVFHSVWIFSVILHTNQIYNIST